MSDRRVRQGLVDAARRMNALGLNRGTSGNLSVRSKDGLLVTPSGRDYESMELDHIVAMKWSGDWTALDASLRPTSEWRFHRDIMTNRPDISAIVHAHPTFATALACLRKDIPAFHYMVAIAGGKIIKCSDYETFGSEALSNAALKALGERKACLLANHGMIACGGTIDEALALGVEVEGLAEQYTQALQIGEPELLSDGEMESVLDKFRAGYGYASEPDAD
jgi:L-fuculose-phosphate aldolase